MTDKHPERLHLKLHPVLADRMRKYAESHGMKLSAVVKKAFELLEDQSVVKASLRKGADDDNW